MSFLSCEEMLAAARSQNLSLAEAILRSDLAESRLTEEASRHAMHHLWHVMEATSLDYDPAQRSRSGLDLEVQDHYEGGRRSVKTLSGGESFQASLALALGMADEMQAAAGGVRLDTLFVDEGFGSLDDEALEQAVRTLADLAEGNRLVGIISHVSALKARIERQILITKTPGGSSAIRLET